MKNAWCHVEALQTSDLIGLVNHIADVIEGALEAPEILKSHCKVGDLHQRQEIMVFYYLYDVMRQIEEITESRVMPTVRERGIFIMCIQLIEKIDSGVLDVHILKGLSALSLMTDTEDFNTYTNQYIKPENVVTLVNFKTSRIAPFQSDLRNNNSIRPLINSIDKAKRQSKMK